MDSYPQPEIVFGPFFVSTSESGSVSPNVAKVGAAMEFATVGGSFRIPLFRKICSYAPNQFLLSELLIHADDIPCDVQYLPFYAAVTNIGKFIPLEATLADLFRAFRVRRTMMSVLEDLTNTLCLGLNFNTISGCLVEPLEKEGFEFSIQHPYGRSVSGIICWIPPANRKSQKHDGILCSWIEFRPRPDGSLGGGTWKEPWNESVSNQLYHELRKRVRGKPCQTLTQFGAEKLLSTFEWTPLARMTVKQARQARVEFIRNHSDLKADFRALALALRDAKLYAESTTVHQVMKFLPSLITESESQVTSPQTAQTSDS